MIHGTKREGSDMLPLSQHPLMTKLKELVSKLSPERQEQLMSELESGELGEETVDDEQ